MPLLKPKKSKQPDSWDRFILLGLSDIHSGFKFGLMQPKTVIFEEGYDDHGNVIMVPVEKQLLPHQIKLNEFLEEDLERVDRIADGCPIVAFGNGDMTHGTKYKEELVTDRMADQVTIAKKNIDRVLQIPNIKEFLLVKGTGSHEMGQGSSMILLSQQLRSDYPDIHIPPPPNHYLLKAVNLTIDIAHHGPGPGIRQWTKGNVLRLYVKSTQQKELESGREPPDLLIRSHLHEYTPEIVLKRTDVKTYTTWAAITPAYCFITDHGKKATQSKGSVDIGMLAYEVINGRIFQCHELMRTVDIRTHRIIK